MLTSEDSLRDGREQFRVIVCGAYVWEYDKCIASDINEWLATTAFISPYAM